MTPFSAFLTVTNVFFLSLVIVVEYYKDPVDTFYKHLEPVVILLFYIPFAFGYAGMLA